MGCVEQCAGCGGRSRVVYFLVAGGQDGRKIDSDNFDAIEGLVIGLGQRNARVYYAEACRARNSANAKRVRQTR